jgi:hypothetical protein
MYRIHGAWRFMMSTVSLAILAAIVVPFGLLGASVAWFAHEDAARARLTREASHCRRRAF